MSVLTLRAEKALPAASAPANDGRKPQTLVPDSERRPLGAILLEDGSVDEGNLLRAVVIGQRQSVPLGEILLSHGWVEEEALTRALARQWRTNSVTLAQTAPDPRLIDEFGADFCLTAGVLPWRRIGGVTYVATSRPDSFDEAERRFPASCSQVRMLICSENTLRTSVLSARRVSMIRRAEVRVAPRESCRTRSELRMAVLVVAALILCSACALMSPATLLLALTGWALVTLAATMAVKVAAFSAALRQHRHDRREAEAFASAKAAPPEMSAPLPVISVMVPLFGEASIAERLVARLSRLTYPRELTDILLVVEETDRITCDALARATLPRWIRVIQVPDGPVKTKPRALNYALNFCRGKIVGIWDAEDQPDPDQLHKVARRFHFAPADVACLQGVLDYYNPRTNWLARCFTIEYASWFRANLRGVAQLGLCVPLGGTTLFMRREALESVGCWDAHNVTEDADLGIRLARRGWRTEMLDTVTQEEANCRALPWVRQRSRWLKGYMMTWGVHMRDPLTLYRELGARRFWAFQAQFLGGISQYLLAPVMWSFWLIVFGLPHPISGVLRESYGGYGMSVLLALLISTEITNIVMGLWAVRVKSHRHLMPWVPTLALYYPLGCLAGWKAIYEVVTRPFFWDKTTHGIFDESTEAAPETVDLAPIPIRTLGSTPALAQTGVIEQAPLQVIGHVG